MKAEDFRDTIWLLQKKIWELVAANELLTKRIETLELAMKVKHGK